MTSSRTPPRIAVIGAGAIGGLIGGLLAESGHNVWLIDRWPEHVAACRDEGLRLTSRDRDRRISVRATTDPADVGEVDLVLIQVKTTATADAARSAKALAGDHTVVLTLQNGLNNVERIQTEVGDHPVLGGVTYHAARIEGPGHIGHTQDGATVVGGNGTDALPRATWVADILTSAGIPAQPSSDIDTVLWSKVVVNVAFNAICALSSLRSGDLWRFAPSREIVSALIAETVAVADGCGVHMDEVAETERVAGIAAGAGDAKPSMLQDLERGGWTEIDAINGAVVLHGERLGIPTPYNRVLTLLIRAAEERVHGHEPEWRQ